MVLDIINGPRISILIMRKKKSYIIKNESEALAHYHENDYGH